MNPEPAPPPLVAFVIGGVQKAATTSLATILSEHPRLHVALGKEAHWFDDDANFLPGAAPERPYEQYFGGAEPGMLCFDATPTYCWWPRAPARIREYNPAMRWVLMLRDPVERAYSHWNMSRRRGKEPLGFLDALAAEDARMLGAGYREALRVSYFSRGLYAEQIRRVWDLFPREQTLILRSDWLRDDPARTVGRVLEFVGVEPLDAIVPVKMNVGAYEAPVGASDRRLLQQRYEVDIRELERMLGWDLSSWLA